MDKNNTVEDSVLKEVAGGLNNYGGKYFVGDILYSKDTNSKRLVIQDIKFDQMTGLLYYGCIQIYSLVQPGTPTLPLPMLPPSQLYQWRDHSTISRSEAGLDEEWEVR